MSPLSDLINDSVFITDIELKTDNIGIIKRNKVNGSGNTHIDAVVKNNPGGKDSMTTYTIKFRVWNNNSFVGDFSIDPKMKMT